MGGGLKGVTEGTKAIEGDRVREVGMAKCSQKLSIFRDLHIKCTRALTFENMSQAISRPFVTCCPAWDPQWGLH